jgi:hypothetical protein
VNRESAMESETLGLANRKTADGKREWPREYSNLLTTLRRQNSSRLPIADCRLPIADCRLPIADCRLPIADCRLPIAVCRLPIADCRLPIADCRLPIADCRLPIADCRLPIADSHPYKQKSPAISRGFFCIISRLPFHSLSRL